MSINVTITTAYRDTKYFERGSDSVYATGGTSPPVAVHNQLKLIQGGTSAEYYHLNSSEHTELVAWLAAATLGNDGSLTLAGAGLTLPTGPAVNEIETSVSDSDVKLPTSGAVVGYAAPLSHTHGQITNAGAIGGTANLPIITTASGVLNVSSFGNGANTFCEGDDARLSDDRDPNSHVLISADHTISGETTGHVLAADSATTFSIRELLGSEINNDLSWSTTVGTVTSVTGGTGITSTGGTTPSISHDSHTGDVTGATGLTIGVDKVLDSHINWGTAATQVSTTDMPEGTNLYYTEGRVSANTDVSAAKAHADIVTGNPHSLNLADIGESDASINYWTLTGDPYLYYNSGNVGIGTATPEKQLTVIETSSADSAFGVGQTGTGDSIIYIDGSNGDFAGSDYGWIKQFNSTLDLEILNLSAGGDLRLGTASSIRMTILNSGNVGIGTATPTAAKLEVHNSSATGNGLFISTNADSASYYALALYDADSGVDLFEVYSNGNVFVDSLGGSGDQMVIVNDDGLLATAAIPAPGSGGLSWTGSGVTGNIGTWGSPTTVVGQANLTFVGNVLTVTGTGYFTGAVGIGVAPSFYQFRVSGTSQFTGNITVTGTIVSTGDMTATDFVTSSDRRLKDVYSSIEDGLDKVMQLNPIEYRWKDHRDDYVHSGFIAQEVQKLYPELVKQDNDGLLTLSYGKMSALAIAGVQGLNYKVDTEVYKLHRRIDALEEEVKILKNGKSS